MVTLTIWKSDIEDFDGLKDRLMLLMVCGYVTEHKNFYIVHNIPYETHERDRFIKWLYFGVSSPIFLTRMGTNPEGITPRGSSMTGGTNLEVLGMESSWDLSEVLGVGKVESVETVENKKVEETTTTAQNIYAEYMEKLTNIYNNNIETAVNVATKTTIAHGLIPAELSTVRTAIANATITYNQLKGLLAQFDKTITNKILKHAENIAIDGIVSLSEVLKFINDNIRELEQLRDETTNSKTLTKINKQLKALKEIKEYITNIRDMAVNEQKIIEKKLKKDRQKIMRELKSISENMLRTIDYNNGDIYFNKYHDLLSESVIDYIDSVRTMITKYRNSNNEQKINMKEKIEKTLMEVTKLMSNINNIDENLRNDIRTIFAELSRIYIEVSSIVVEE